MPLDELWTTTYIKKEHEQIFGVDQTNGKKAVLDFIVRLQINLHELVTNKVDS